MVLSGRESLIRLIGKRRRFLPNRHSILFDPIPIPLPNPIPIQAAEPQQPSQPNPQNDDVNCPVCGLNLPGDNHRINSHLDECLSKPKVKSTKRKLTQRTLLQLNFRRPLSKPKFETLSNGDNTVSAAAPPWTNGEFEELTENHEIGIESTTSETSYSLPLNNVVPDSPDVDYTPDVLGVTLETFIVGRRYADDREEVCPGTDISLLRDPQNVKDPNAIKVVSADSACSRLLGFLPRELAQYLSPLIDKYGLEFQGQVSPIPKHSLAVVPIQITCHRTSECENENADETFKSLWKNAQRVVDFASRNPPSSVKYQLNFCLMLREVLRNNIHLLTEEEKTYMESFTSLSNDSQRLFIRLYTRKGYHILK